MSLIVDVSPIVEVEFTRKELTNLTIDARVRELLASLAEGGGLLEGGVLDDASSREALGIIQGRMEQIMGKKDYSVGGPGISDFVNKLVRYLTRQGEQAPSFCYNPQAQEVYFDFWSRADQVNRRCGLRGDGLHMGLYSGSGRTTSGMGELSWFDKRLKWTDEPALIE